MSESSTSGHIFPPTSLVLDQLAQSYSPKESQNRRQHERSAPLLPPCADAELANIARSVLDTVRSECDVLTKRLPWLCDPQQPCTPADFAVFARDMQRIFDAVGGSMRDASMGVTVISAGRLGSSVTRPNNDSLSSPDQPLFRLVHPEDGIDEPGDEEDAFMLSSAATVTTDEAGFDNINELTLLGEVGHGKSGRVMQCFDNVANENRALKIIPRHKIVKEASKSTVTNRDHANTPNLTLQKEVAIMKKLRHPNIVRLYEYIDDPTSEMVYLVMQYVDNGPILKFDEEMHCTPLAISVVQRDVQQLASAVGYMHAQGVVHCDIKPDNVLVDTKGNVYLADFGVSELIDKLKERVEGHHGTPLFFSPDLLQSGHCTPASDMWALGVTIYAMLFGRLPFNGDNFITASHSILNDPLTFPPVSAALLKWTKLLRRLLERDPSKRMTAKELKHDPLLQLSMDDPDALEQVLLSPVEEPLTCTADDLKRAIAVAEAVPVEDASDPLKARLNFRRVILRNARGAHGRPAILPSLNSCSVPRGRSIRDGMGQSLGTPQERTIVARSPVLRPLNHSTSGYPPSHKFPGNS